MASLTYKGCVYPWQCDQIGHMNVMWYVGKFDEATWNAFASVGLTPAYFRDQNRGMAAVQQTLNYKAELVAGDVIEIDSRFIEVRDKAVRFVHEMRNTSSGAVVALCELTGVHIDRTLRKSIPLPEEVRAAIRGLITEPQEARMDR
jgi:acyl-CoA thioester hydrolase